MADFVIGWRADQKRFDAVTIRAELTDRRSGLDLPLEIEPIEYEPEGIIELVPDEESTPELAVFRAELTKAVLADPDFYRKVAQPVQVTITAHPVAEQTASVVFADAGRISRTCTVEIEAPPAELHWRVTDLESDAPVNLAIDDQVLEIEADGQHTIELEMWLVRYQPQSGRVDRDLSVHFTHKTDATFRTRILAPHPESRPWVVARAGSGNRRDKSKWKSNAWLPDPRHPEQVPLTGFINVKAWEAGDILDRPSADLIRLRDGATPILEAPVPVRLVPVRVSGERLLPTGPIAADGSSTEVKIRFTRTRTGRLLSGAQVSWELDDSDGCPGGTVEPSGVWLTPEHGGHARLVYTPPPLTYAPGGRYDQPLRLFSGEGEHRDESASAPVLYVSPRVRARLLGTKPGLDFEPPYELDVPAGRSPEELVVHHGFASLDPTLTAQHDVFDAAPEITVVTERAEVPVLVEARTDATGTYTWRLPELVDGLAALPPGPRRRITLEPYQQESAGDLDDASYRLVHTYRTYLADPKVTTTLARLIDPPLQRALEDQPLVLARNLCRRPQEDHEKTRYGTDLVLAATRGTMIADRIHADMFERGLDMAVKFVVDLAEALIKVFKVGEELVKWLGGTRAGKALVAAGGYVAEKFRSMLPMLTQRLPTLVPFVEGVVQSAAAGGSGFVRQVTLLVRQCMELLATQANLLLTQAESLALQMAYPGGTLGEGAKYAAKKSAENSVKFLTKQLSQLFAGKGYLYDIVERVSLGLTGKDPAKLEIKSWIRNQMMGGMAEDAKFAIAHTTNSVSAFTYAYPPSTIEHYFAGLHELETGEVSLSNKIAAADWGTSTFSTVCDVLAVVAVACTVLSLGTAAPISFASLSALSLLKLNINVGIHLTEAYGLVDFAYYAGGVYRELTIGLTGRVP